MLFTPEPIAKADKFISLFLYLFLYLFVYLFICLFIYLFLEKKKQNAKYISYFGTDCVTWLVNHLLELETNDIFISKKKYNP